jgi:4-hydroxymandelate oxidase
MDFEKRARAALPPHISAYYAAAAGSGVGLDEGTAEWSAVRSRAVFVGRPVLWALAAAGKEGAEQVIKSLTDELALVMVQLGAAHIDELTPDLLATSRATC